MIIAGIDFSITCPAICIYDIEKELTYKNVEFFFNQHAISNKEKSRRNEYVIGHVDMDNIHCYFNDKIENDEHNLERYNNLVNWTIDILKNYNVEYVILEGYAMGASGKVFNIAELTGILKNSLYHNYISFETPAPTAVKKTFTGKGNAKKENMIEYFNKINNIDISNLFFQKETTNSPVSDIVDSFALVDYFKKTLDK